MEELIDSTLAQEEEELLEEARKKIAEGDFSDFIPLEKLNEVLRGCATAFFFIHSLLSS